ncbi:hypothetical protein [Neobacillus soli]|uniref:hypothetical protein n=1 Tax=Neobacillus soli TaxID=220688 RepID=UPI000824449C|nr:hypothetical protein [Neobacillus soli]
MGYEIFELRKEIKETPLTTGIEVKNSFMDDNFEALTQLYLKGVNPLSKEKFIQIKDGYSGITDFKNFEVLDFGNGTMAIIHLTHKEDASSIKVQDIRLIPKEMQSLFK